MGNQHMNQVHAMGSAVGNKHRFATNVFALKSWLPLRNEDTWEKMWSSTRDALLQILFSWSICSTLLKIEQIDTGLTKDNIVQTEHT